MKPSALQALRLGGYAPATLLDVGANIGEFTRTFLSVFPDCVPTLIEPNPHCCARLRESPHEVIAVAAGARNGTADLFLTKEWLESTGASLYRENTAYFRDDVLTKETVDTARLDDIFHGRRFDFVKIDVQGSELDVLIGGSRLISQADYVLIEVPVVEYNLGAPTAEQLFEKLSQMGFRCGDVTEFHRLPGVMDGNLLQIDFLFERVVPRATQNARLASLHDRGDLLGFLRQQRAASRDFTVLDVGASGNPWSADLVDATFDRSPCPGPATQFLGNFNSSEDWQPVLAHVAKYGKYSYSICSHVLGSLAYPTLTMNMLPLVSKAGFIAVPSSYLELLRHEGPYRGFINHRWIFIMRNAEVVLVPKVSMVEFLNLPGEEAWRQQSQKMELQIHWRGGFHYAILNGDYLGPNPEAVINMYSELFTKDGL